MILEEILAILLSLVTSVTHDPPEVRQHGFQSENVAKGNTTRSNGHSDGDLEYHRLARSSLLEQTNRHQKYGAINHQRFGDSLYCCFIRSVWISFTIKMAVLPLGLLSIALLYINLNTTNLCFELKSREDALPFNIKMWNAAGDCIQIMLIHCWFPATLALLFGWRKFKLNYYSTMFISFVLGNLVVIYTIFLLILGVYGTKRIYRCPDNVIFLVGVMYNCHFVASQIVNDNNHSVAFPKMHVMTMISVQFVFGLILTMTHIYGIVPWFIETKSDVKKVMIASITLLLSVVPLVVCKHFALQSSEFADPRRTFVLLCFLHGLPEIMFRIRQSDVEDIWLFVGISVLHGFVNLIGRASEKLRHAAWTRFFLCIRGISWCIRLEQLPDGTQRHRRLKASMEIQTFLFDYTALTLTQSYVALYLITNFEVSSWEILKVAFIRISIGFGIAFLFNSLSILVQIRWRNIPVSDRWTNQWKLNIVVNALAAAMTVWYYTPVLLNVIQDHAPYRANLIVQNCTAPFSSF